MNLNKACEILKLNKNDLDKTKIKKAYCKLAKKYHPDKSDKDTNSYFINISESYQFLNSHIENKENEKEDKIISLLSKFTNLEKSKISFLIEKTQDFLNETTFHILQTTERTRSIQIINQFIQYKSILSLNEETISKLNNIKLSKLKEPYLLKPTLKNLFFQDIFLFEINNEKLCIPLWHHFLEFDNNIYIELEPKLPSNIIIDENNNIIILHKVSVKSLFENPIYTINICNNITFPIIVEKLSLKLVQTLIFSSQGIPKINDKDIFCNKEISDVIINLHILYG